MRKSLLLLLAPVLVLACTGKDPIPTPDDPVDKPSTGEVPNPAKPASEIPEHHFLLGSLLGFEGNLRSGNTSRSGGSASTTYFNQPLFDTSSFESDDSDWWDDIIEEFEYAGLDYIMPNCRGHLPQADTDRRYYTDHGDPMHLKDMLDAMKRRGTQHLKVAIFDDAPASWAAARNLDLYGSYVSTMGNKASDAYPIDNLDAFYKYVWDYNIKPAFANFYGENAENNPFLLRIDGKPLLVIWSPNGFLNVEYGGARPDCTGRLKAVLDRLHSDFLATFGEEVHICVDRAFPDRDPLVTKRETDSMNSWFNTDSKSSYYGRSVHTMNNLTVGVAVPGFSVNDLSGNRMFIDADHGKRLTANLRDMITYKADLVILEGFSDMLENAAYWRSTDKVFYDYPNQRLNILRKFNSSAPYPASLRVEAETCDDYQDLSKGNRGKQYRSGDLDVRRCTDGFKGWCVTDTEAGEWLRWVELPYRKGDTDLILRYASTGECTVRFDVDGNPGRETTLPATGGDWSEQTVGTVSFEENGWRETVLHILSGSADVNSFTLAARQDS